MELLLYWGLQEGLSNLTHYVYEVLHLSRAFHEQGTAWGALQGQATAKHKLMFLSNSSCKVVFFLDVLPEAEVILL